MRFVSLLMITWNKKPFLERSLPAILESLDGRFDHEFLILDNGSDDDTSSLIYEYSSKYSIIKHCVMEKNVGLNGYWHLEKEASGDILVTVDDDIFYVTPNWEAVFSRILYAEFGGKRIAYLCATPLNRDGGLFGKIAGHGKLDKIDIAIGPAGGWFTAIKKNVLEELGGFHVGMEEMYLEDKDIQIRAQKAGYLCGSTPQVRVFHARSPKFYESLGVMSTYDGKKKLAEKVGIELEEVT